MSSFLNVQSVVVPRDVASQAHEHLRQMGEMGCEGIALWVGRLDGDTFQVLGTYIPEQTALISETGVCIMVDGHALHRFNVWLYEQQMVTIAQLHSHPTEAFHSETDDTFPIATAAGSLSLVIPDFAREPFTLGQCAVFRLVPGQGWVWLTSAEVENLIRIEE